MLRNGDLTRGGITGTLLRFTLPMMAGSLLQQCYNIADTLIVGQCIGADALAAVGSAYTLMVFLISILLGLSIGSGTVFSLHYGAGNHSALRRSIFVSFVLIGAVTCVLNMAVFVWLDPILRLLQVPQDIYGMMRRYENINRTRKARKGMENGVNTAEITFAVLIKVLSAIICSSTT